MPPRMRVNTPKSGVFSKEDAEWLKAVTDLYQKLNHPYQVTLVERLSELFCDATTTAGLDRVYVSNVGFVDGDEDLKELVVMLYKKRRLSLALAGTPISSCIM